MSIIASIQIEYPILPMDNTEKKKQEDLKNGCFGCLSIFFLSILIFGACSALTPKTKYSISCVNEKGSTEWEDGSIQKLTSNLGAEVFVWNKEKKVVEVSAMRGGAQVKVEVPASLNGSDLVFSANSISYILNTSTGKSSITSTGSSLDGNFVTRMEGSCVGFK